MLNKIIMLTVFAIVVTSNITAIIETLMSGIYDMWYIKLNIFGAIICSLAAFDQVLDISVLKKNKNDKKD